MPIKLGVLGAADIAFRRFLPALKKSKDIIFYGIASRDQSKANKFTKIFGGQVYETYENLLKDKMIDAVYIPLPPALHFEWAKMALQYGKHIYMEKPFCTNLSQTIGLVEFAKKRKKVLHENYMFIFHKQIEIIKDILREHQLGEIRLIRIAFGFPKRAETDFRYNKDLGGGSLLDCGGYTLKLASELMGDDLIVKHKKLEKENYDIDLYGAATLENKFGKIIQIAFGMDNSYLCELEIWGSNGYLKAPRIFTAPADFDVNLELGINNKKVIVNVGMDDQFFKSIQYFIQLVTNPNLQQKNYESILKQAILLDRMEN